MVEQLAFPLVNGGSIPTSPLQCRVFVCEWGDIAPIFRDNHYKSDHIGGDIALCFRLDFNCNTIGGAVFGPPRHQVYGTATLDLRRFACVEDAPKNTESFFLSKCILFIKKNKLADRIVTFADETQGHKGIIYKACNFRKIGVTAKGKHIVWNGRQYHMRSLTINRPYSRDLKEALKNGEATIVNGLHKNIFAYEISKKSDSATARQEVKP